LHHICPRAFLANLRASSQTAHRDSVMNLCWMSQQTNFAIGDASPAVYFDRYRADPEFEDILASQLIPLDFAQRTTFQRADYHPFLLARARLFASRLRAALPDVAVTITDK
jgi:hypothetical protein